MNIQYYTFRPQCIGFIFVDEDSLQEIADHINTSPSVSTPAAVSGTTVTWQNQFAGSPYSVSPGDTVKMSFSNGSELPLNPVPQTPDQSYEAGVKDLQAISRPQVSYEIDES